MRIYLTDAVTDYIQKAENIDRFYFDIHWNRTTIAVKCCIKRGEKMYESYDGIRFKYKGPAYELPHILDFTKHHENYGLKMNFLKGLLQNMGRNEYYWIDVDVDTKKRIRSDPKSSLERALSLSPLFEKKVLNIVFEMAEWKTLSLCKSIKKRMRQE